MRSAPHCWPVTRSPPSLPGLRVLTIPTGRAHAPLSPRRYRQTHKQCCHLHLIDVNGGSSKAWQNHGCSPGLVPTSEFATLFPGPTGPQPPVQGHRPTPARQLCWSVHSLSLGGGCVSGAFPLTGAGPAGGCFRSRRDAHWGRGGGGLSQPDCTGAPAGSKVC